MHQCLLHKIIWFLSDFPGMITVKYSCFENSKIKVQSANNNFRPSLTPNRIQLCFYVRSQLFHLVPLKNALPVVSQIVLCSQTVEINTSSIFKKSTQQSHTFCERNRIILFQKSMWCVTNLHTV